MPLLRVLPDDAPAIARLVAIGRETFAVTFAESNDPADLQAFLDTTFAPEQIAQEVACPGSLHYLLTDVAGQDLGYLKLNLPGSFSDDVDLPQALELQRIYLLPQAQGTGAAAQLMQQTLDAAREHDLGWVWLGVWEHNPRAVRFYERWGFERFGQHTFMVGSDAQTDLLMRRAVTQL